jgi:hypothetical protein
VPRDGEEAAPAPAEPGRIRREFSTAAKPALLTPGDEGGLAPGQTTPAFRYLVVPLRIPARA